MWRSTQFHITIHAEMAVTSWLSIAGLLVASASSVVALLKEKRERRGKRLHRNLLFALTALGFIVGAVFIWRADKDAAQSERRHSAERAADEQQIAGLTSAVQTQIKSNETDYLRNQAEVQHLQDQLTDLQKQVATEELRKKIDALQSELAKSLAGAPKAKIDASFWTAEVQDDVVSEVYAPVEDHVVTFNLTLFNHSNVNARSGAMWLRICDRCKFNKDPAGFQHVAGAPDFERLFIFTGLPAGSRMQRMEVEVQVPSGAAGKMPVRTKVTCDNCEVPNEWKQMLVTLGTTNFKLPPANAPARFGPSPSSGKSPD